MNEGVGSTTILVIMMVFLTVVSAYMAFNVNYTKAFRLKNKIISIYDQYNGDCNVGTTCWDEISDYASKIGVERLNNLRCDDSSIRPANSDLQAREFFCEYRVTVNNSSGGTNVQDEGKEYYYYHIVTRIDIKIPVVQNVFSLRFLTVSGDTKVYSRDR